MDLILFLCIWNGMILGTVALLLLLIPLSIRINGQVGDREGVDYELSVKWAWGVVGIDKIAGDPVRLSLLGLGVRRFSGAISKGKKKKPKRRSGKDFVWSTAGALKNHIPVLMHVLDQMAGAAFLNGRLMGRIGLADPADTAMLALLCQMINRRYRRFSLSLACDYDEPVVRIAASLNATMIVGYLGVVAARLMLQKRTRVMLQVLRHA